MNSHESVIIKKPWGFEYLAYKNDQVALWILHIKKGHKTSLHCHPTKTTGLVVVRGTVEMNFIADSKIIAAPAKQMIRRGLFHQTHALTDDVIVFEIETPVNKNDLVRLNDVYGRENSGYENFESELPKNEECLWFDDTPREVDVFGRKIRVERVTTECINSKNEADIIIFLRGSLIKDVEGTRHEVIRPGDVGVVNVVKVVLPYMDGFTPDGVIMTLS